MMYKVRVGPGQAEAVRDQIKAQGYKCFALSRINAWHDCVWVDTADPRAPFILSFYATGPIEKVGVDDVLEDAFQNSLQQEITRELDREIIKGLAVPGRLLGDPDAV